MPRVEPRLPSLKRRRDDDAEDDDGGNDDEPRQFRRVRLRCRRLATRKGSQEGAAHNLFEFEGGMIRCICGTQESMESLSDRVFPSTSWLVQCDNCQVWQHRSCVGTANGRNPSGGFYCEQCSRLKAVDGLVTYFERRAQLASRWME